MEALGNPAIEHPGRPHPSLHSGLAKGLDILGYANYQRKIIGLAKEEDQACPRTLPKRIAVGQGVFCVDHRD